MDGLYVLLEDVSLQGQTWTPIGTAEEPFTGVFNGNNKTIDGLTLSNPEMNAGLFGVNSGSVKNTALADVSISSEHSIVGGIAGQNNGLIENCHVQSGTLSIKGSIGAGSTVGGICGQNNDGGMIQNCSNASAVTGENKLVGGIVGYINTTDTSIDNVQNCYYLNTSSTKAVGNISTLDTTSSKTSDEIKTLADTLGDSFKNSTERDGYPKLSWEE